MPDDSGQHTLQDRFKLDNEYVSTLVSIVQNLEKYLMYIFYIFLLVVIISEVFRRYILNMSSLWSGEVARYSFLYLTYLGISWAAYKRSHIRIDIFLNQVSQQVENYLYLFSNFIMMIFGGYVIWYTIPIIEASLEFGAQTQALSIQLALVQIAIPIGLSLMMIRLLQRTYYDIMDIRAGRPVFKGENIFIDEGNGEKEGWQT